MPIYAGPIHLNIFFVAELVMQEPSANWKSLDVSSQKNFPSPYYIKEIIQL
jgi:hypothetical protein